MANESQRDVWNAADVASSWRSSENISGLGTASIMEALRLQRGERVLDVACGGGKTTIEAARRVGPDGHVTGIDIAERMLALAKARRADAGLDNVELVLADAQVDAFPSGPFDAVLSQFGIMFFDDPLAALTNIRRHMAPGARFTFIVWQPEQTMAWSPSHIVLDYLPDPEENPETTRRASSWGDRAFVDHTLRSAGFIDVAIEAHNVDAELPADTDVPTSLLTRAIDPGDHEAVLAAWRKHRARFLDGDVLRLDVKMFLITGRTT